MGAVDTRDLTARLLADLPDVPRWIETRAILRSPHAQLFAGPVAADGVAARLLHDAMSVVAVVGRPPASALAAALDGTTPMTPVVAQPENASRLAALFGEIGPAGDGAEWRGERMVFHRLTSVPVLPDLSTGVSIRLLADRDALDHLPSGLRYEISHARVMTATAAAFVDGVAAHVVRFLIDHLRGERLEPV